MIRLVVLVFLSVSSLAARSSELDSLIALLDDEIKNKSRYEQIKKSRIDAISSFLKKPGLDSLERFRYNKLLIAEYEKYSFDSTILYIEKNLKLAEELDRQDLINESLILLGSNLSNVGKGKEAVDILAKVNASQLNKDQQIRFHNIQRKLFEDLSYYASSAITVEYYRSRYDHFRSELMKRVPETHDVYLDILEKDLLDKGQLDECLKINQQRLNRTTLGEPRYSLVTFQRSLIHGAKGDLNQQKKYLILSAISDIRAVVMDNASMTILASILYHEGDIEKAYFYIQSAYEDAIKFNSIIRFEHISKTLSPITRSYQELSDHQKDSLELNIMIISILSMVLLVTLFFIYRQMKRLSIARNAGIDWSTGELQDRMKAEVRVLRAHFYWDLVRHYGWVPLVTAQFESFQDAKEVTQVEPNEILTFIATELLESVDHLPNIATDAEKGRVTADMVNMLIARIYLLHEGFFKPVFGITDSWQDANGTVIDETFVKSRVDEILASGRYSLLPDYNDVFDWDNENSEESVFEWQYSENALSADWGGWGIRGNFAVVFFGPRTPQGDPNISEGWSFNTLSWSLYDEFEPGDPRLVATVYDADANLTSYAPGYQNTGYFNAKYMPRTAYRSTDVGIPDHNWRVNYKDMRLAELYLIGAELHLNSNPTIAADYLNEVRVRAMGESARLPSITLDDIYHERRVELACEGHRKWDLLRRGLDYTKTKLDQSFDVPDGIDNAIEFSNGVFRTETWGMLPIPASEIRLTNDGQLKQYVPAYGGG